MLKYSKITVWALPLLYFEKACIHFFSEGPWNIFFQILDFSSPNIRIIFTYYTGYFALQALLLYPGSLIARVVQENRVIFLCNAVFLWSKQKKFFKKNFRKKKLFFCSWFLLLSVKHWMLKDILVFRKNSIYRGHTYIN